MTWCISAIKHQAEGHGPSLHNALHSALHRAVHSAFHSALHRALHGALHTALARFNIKQKAKVSMQCSM